MLVLDTDPEMGLKLLQLVLDACDALHTNTPKLGRIGSPR